VQPIMTLLVINGRAAVVLPDNVLFEAGAGRRSAALLNDFGLLHRVTDGADSALRGGVRRSGRDAPSPR